MNCSGKTTYQCSPVQLPILNPLYLLWVIFFTFSGFRSSKTNALNSNLTEIYRYVHKHFVTVFSFKTALQCIMDNIILLPLHLAPGIEYFLDNQHM